MRGQEQYCPSIRGGAGVLLQKNEPYRCRHNQQHEAANELRVIVTRTDGRVEDRVRGIDGIIENMGLAAVWISMDETFYLAFRSARRADLDKAAFVSAFIDRVCVAHRRPAHPALGRRLAIECALGDLRRCRRPAPGLQALEFVGSETSKKPNGGQKCQGHPDLQGSHKHIGYPVRYMTMARAGCASGFFGQDSLHNS